MKILIIHHCDSWGGAGVSLRECCKMLRTEHEVTVCLPHKNSPVEEALKSLDINILAIEDNIAMISAYNGGPKFLTRTFFKNLLHTNSNWKRISEIINWSEFDAVLLNSITLCWMLVPLAKINVVKYVYVRETKPIRHPGALLQKCIIDHYADGVLYISDFDLREFSFHVNRSTVIRDCIEGETTEDAVANKEACREKYDLPVDDFLVLFMGGTERLKGYEIALKAMDIISDTHIKLVIAGKTDSEKQIRNPKIIYLGSIDGTATLYKACNVLIFPSVEGHQGRPIFEAGAAGVPVVVSDFPQTADEAINGYNGLTVRPRDPCALAQAIVKLAADKEKCNEYGINNKAMAVKRHSFSSCQKELLSFFAEAI